MQNTLYFGVDFYRYAFRSSKIKLASGFCTVFSRNGNLDLDYYGKYSDLDLDESLLDVWLSNSSVPLSFAAIEQKFLYASLLLGGAFINSYLWFRSMHDHICFSTFIYAIYNYILNIFLITLAGEFWVPSWE